MGSRRNRSTKPAPAVAAEPATAPAELLQPSGSALAELLLDPQRTDVVVVVSHDAKFPECRLDAVQLSRKLDGIAVLALVQTGRTTYDLEDLLSKEAGIFGNAVRAYPPGTRWLEHTRESPLHLVRSAAECEDAATWVVRDAEKMAAAIVPQPRTAAPAPPAPIDTTGTVVSLATNGARAVVALPSGAKATIRQEFQFPGIALDWLLAPGQDIRGSYDAAQHSFKVPAAAAPTSVRGIYSDGSVALALVESVHADKAEVLLYPGQRIGIPLARISSNVFDTADDLLSVGEVVAVRVRFEGGKLLLSMLDVDDDEDIVPAPALLRGGIPWLELGRNKYDDEAAVGGPLEVPAAPAEAGFAGDGTTGAPEPGDSALPGAAPAAPATAAPAAAPGALKQSLLRQDALKAENNALKDEVHHLRHQLANGNAGQIQLEKLGTKLQREREEAHHLAVEVNEANARAKDLAERLRAADVKLRELKTNYRNAGKAASSESKGSDRGWFATSEDYVRFEVLRTWAKIIPAAEKAEFPLRAFSVGPAFCDSLLAEPKDKRVKALRAVVDLLAGRSEALKKRQAHELRTGKTGSAPGVTRPGTSGIDHCWRLHVEERVSAARRLHYWKCADGTIELSRVVAHEDMEP
ncbi:hypothetical protein [Arthrobacter sp. 35W]|uniref:hypothetical protein n=1 Tax=Arthrobacter sp. 35W TaxID=1132441 RepID=UPI00041FC673|nr:hypothetical protein [Arthrobacter sp. 35W]